MTTQTQTQVAAELNISLSALWSLSGNAHFPTPVSNDGAGNALWNTSDITAFAALMTAAKSHGWQWDTIDLASANWTMMAATAIGPSYRRGSGFLLDV
jgi:predicted DNA-binding transcriptional regulator AlpA